MLARMVATTTLHVEDDVWDIDVDDCRISLAFHFTSTDHMIHEMSLNLYSTSKFRTCYNSKTNIIAICMRA